MLTETLISTLTDPALISTLTDPALISTLTDPALISTLTDLDTDLALIQALIQGLPRP